MRKSYVLFAGAALLAACNKSSDSAMDADLKKDLEVASSSDGIILSSVGSGTQVVSAIEQTAPPARRKAPSARVRRHVAAPKSPPRVVQAKAPATVTQDEEQSVAMNPANDAAPVSPRPRPVAVSYPSGPSSGGDDGRVSSGSGAGAVLGSILGAVIRGGAVGDVDHCDPRTDSRRSSRGSILIGGTRLPGRIGGAGRVMPSGGNTASRFPH
ncbi:MAG TPA: hypothetical protein VM166_01420 [Gemmatimonadaceae bacterium]|nr:hypothetical protein [Gemmatimonadaceae bacterium]